MHSGPTRSLVPKFFFAIAESMGSLAIPVWPESPLPKKT